MVVTEKYCIDQLPMIPLIDYTMIVGVVKTVGVVKCPDIHFQKLGNYADVRTIIQKDGKHAHKVCTSDMQGLVWGEPELPEDVFSFC